MSSIVHPAQGTGTRVPDTQEHPGSRYLWWCHYVEPESTAVQKAQAHEAFAAEFRSMPASQEPYEGWAETMAYLCQRIARRHRGEPVGEWIPRWERVRHARDSEAVGEVRQAS